jgi:hypothetical protein
MGDGDGVGDKPSSPIILPPLPMAVLDPASETLVSQAFPGVPDDDFLKKSSGNSCNGKTA